MADALRRLPAPAPALLAAVPAGMLLVGWLADDGGYAATTWYPGGLLLAGLLLMALVGLGPGRLRPTRAQAVALAAFGGYAAWSYASIAWAEVPGDAFEGANRTLVYAIALALFTLLPWTVPVLRGFLAALLLAIGVLALVTVLRIAADADPSEAFVNARVAAPLGYQNASGAAWTACALAGLVLASRREVHWLVRAGLVGCAPLWIGLGLMSQSRGWLIALPVCAALVLAAVPGRLRLLAAAVPGAVALLVTAPTLLEVYDRGAASPDDRRTGAHATEDIAAAFDPAARALVLATAACVVVGALLAVLDRLVRVPWPFGEPGRRAGIAVALVTVVAGVAGVLVVTDGRPAAKARSGWDSFKAYDVAATGGSRFASLGSSRYDFWRVAVHEWRDHPVGGLGQDNYAAAYLREGRSEETPRWVHSLPLRLLTHTGIVGALLFAVALGGLAAGLLTAARRLDRPGRAVVVAAVAPLLVWLVQGAQDWLWEFPALSVLGLGLAAAATALGRPGHVPAGPPAGRSGRLAGRLAAGLAAVLVLVALVPAWLSARLTDRAVAAAGQDPQGALDRLADAARLSPLAAGPDVTAGAIALNAGRRDEAVRRFEAAARRDPDAWFPRLELGLLLAAEDRERAVAELERARRANPRSPVVREALRAVRRGRSPDVSDVNAELAEGARQVTR